MPNQKLLAIITAFTLAAGTIGAYATYTMNDLQIIDQMVMNRDWAELRSYLKNNPELLDGDDALAVQLREFIDSMNRGFWARMFVSPHAPSQESIQIAIATY